MVRVELGILESNVRWGELKIYAVLYRFELNSNILIVRAVVEQ